MGNSEIVSQKQGRGGGSRKQKKEGGGRASVDKDSGEGGGSSSSGLMTCVSFALSQCLLFPLQIDFSLSKFDQVLSFTSSLSPHFASSHIQSSGERDLKVSLFLPCRSGTVEHPRCPVGPLWSCCGRNADSLLLSPLFCPDICASCLLSFAWGAALDLQKPEVAVDFVPLNPAPVSSV